MIRLLLNSIALEPNRWTPEKIAYYKLSRLLKPIAEAGFHFVEIWQYHISRESEGNIKAFHWIANCLGISFPIVGMYPKLHLIGEERQQETEKIKKIFEYAKILGAVIVKIFVGNISAATVSDKEYELSVEFIREMTDLAKTYDLIITGETHHKTLFEDINSCQKLLKEVGVDNFKVCYQPLELHDTEKALGDYNIIADDVIHVHYQGHNNKKMDFLENSELDYEKLTRALVDKKFNGHICIEFVKDCVVKKPADFNLDLVLQNAQRDRGFVLKVAERYELEVSV